MLVKRPGLSALAIVALAVGVGLTTTMFSIVYAMVLKGLPYERSDRLAAIFRDRPAQGIQFMPVGIHDFTDWREQQKSFDAIAAFYAETVNVSGSEGQPVRYLGAYASANLFDILRVRPMLGRTFRPEEDKPSTPPVMILSYRAWQDRFHGDPQVIGKSVRTNSEMTTIVGVMPQKFDFPGQMDAWLPLRIDPLAFPRGSGPALEGTQLQALARLKDGVSFETAQAEMSLIARRIAADHPESNDGIGVTVMRQTDLVIGPQGRSMLLIDAGRGIRRAPDCVCERGESAARADGPADEGDRDQDGARRRTPANHLAAARRNARARGCRYGGRPARGEGRHRFLQRLRGEPGAAALARGRLRSRRHRLRACVDGLERDPGWHHSGAPRVEGRRERDPQRRSARVVGPASWADQQGAGRRAAGLLVRSARRGRPDDQDHRQRGAIRLRLQHGERLHGEARPVREGLPDPARRSVSSTTACGSRSGTCPASGRLPTHPISRRAGSRRCSGSPSTGWRIRPSRTILAHGAS